jgi:hypothetical protein
MKKNNRASFITFSTMLLAGVMMCITCSTQSPADKKQLLTPESISPKNLTLLKEKGEITDSETIVYAYSKNQLKTSGTILTNKKIIVYSKEKNEQENLENIFDLSLSHGPTEDKQSTITIYRKDDSRFSFEFPGGLDIDERFFSTLRDLWRKALDTKKTNANN